VIILRFDGGARPTNPGPAACAWTLDMPGFHREGSRRLGRMTNNEAEYMGLINGLQEAMLSGLHDIEVRSDSKLVINQMTDLWKVRSNRLSEFRALALQHVRWMRQHGGDITFVWVPREENSECDAACTALLT
jgi:ribonuclease HI